MGHVLLLTYFPYFSGKARYRRISVLPVFARKKTIVSFWNSGSLHYLPWRRRLSIIRYSRPFSSMIDIEDIFRKHSLPARKLPASTIVVEVTTEVRFTIVFLDGWSRIRASTAESLTSSRDVLFRWSRVNEFAPPIINTRIAWW